MVPTTKNAVTAEPVTRPSELADNVARFITAAGTARLSTGEQHPGTGDSAPPGRTKGTAPLRH